MNRFPDPVFCPSTRRRGSAMAIALVVLLVVGLMSGLALQAILRSHRQSREEVQRAQAELLADSALNRAVELINRDPAWKGETWVPPVESSGDDIRTAGEAIIRVEAGGDSTESRIWVTAVFPRDPVHRAQATRQFNYIHPKRGENP